MDWLLILEKVFSWAIPVICTAIVAWIGIPAKKAMLAQQKGQDIINQETWDSRATKIKSEIEDIKKNHTLDKTEILTEINSLKDSDKTTNEALNKILETIEAHHVEDQKRLDDIDAKNTTAFKDIYQRDLIVDGKTYIRYKRITPQQLANYEKRYEQYKALGGNGDVEIWIKKIRTLPVYYPEIQENEKSGDT